MGVLHGTATNTSTDQESLPTLQNLIKRDPDGYKDDFERRLRHFQSIIDIQRSQPGAESKELVALLGFISAVCPCFPQLTAEVPAQLASLLDDQLDALDPPVRRAIFQALVLLRNRGMLEPLALLQLCFRCFRGRDKVLRERLYMYVVSDIKGVNAKHKDNALNRRLQTHVFAMLNDTSVVAAKYALRVLVQLYRRHVWRDTRTVNVVAGALFCPHSALRIAALHFLLGAHDQASTADSDDEDAGTAAGKTAERMQKNLKKEGATSTRNSKKTLRKLKRAQATAKKKPAGEAAASFAAIHLLHDPHAIGEKLFSEVRKQGEKFDVRLMMLNLLSRLIGAHRLLIPNFYPFVQRYMQPHQREITLVLAYLVQGCHELVPPESLQPLLRTLAQHFVSDKSRPEMVAIGINTTREVCARVPLAMDATLLSDLLEYRKDRDKAVVASARSLLQLFRAKRPELLHKKYRGKGADLTATPAAYGALEAATGVEGAELLQRHEERLRARNEGAGVGRDLVSRDEAHEWAERHGEESDAENSRIARLKQLQQEAGGLRGAKRRRAEEALLDTDDLPSALEVEGEAVDTLDIEGAKARRNATREEKLANTKAGRTDHSEKKGFQSKKTGGKSNKEKKKNQPFSMIRKSNSVKSKVRHRDDHARADARRAKKMFKGRVKRGAA